MFFRVVAMTVVGYHDPPDWDFNNVESHGGANWSIQLLAILYILVGPLLIMNLLLAITVNNTKNLKMRGKTIQTKTRIKDFHRYAIIANNYVFKYFAPGFSQMKKFECRDSSSKLVC